MKIHVDKKNKRVIADGGYKGRHVRSVAHCVEDEFDEDFGVDLATAKFKIREAEIQLKIHETSVMEHHKMVLWHLQQIKDEEEIIRSVRSKIGRKISEKNKMVDDYFSGN